MFIIIPVDKHVVFLTLLTFFCTIRDATCQLSATFDYNSGQASLTCTPYSSPIFKLNGNTISASSKYQISGQTLTIKPLKKSDVATTYSCTDGSSTQAFSTITVIPLPYQVDYLMVSAIEGLNAELTCYLFIGTESTAFSSISWTWTLNSNLITNGGRYSIQSDNSQSRLTIQSSQTSDSGVYYCQPNAVKTDSSVISGRSRNTTLGVKSKLSPVWPFLGTILECILLAFILWAHRYYQKKKN